MVTPGEVLGWKIDGMRDVSTRAAEIADALVGTSKTMRDTIYELAWRGDARTAAEDRAEREREQIAEVAAAYDALSSTTAGTLAAMSHPISEIRSIIQNYVVPPVALSDSWVVDGVDDWNSEAGHQLSRLGGLVSTLGDADETWGARIAEANQTLSTMAPEETLASALAVIEDSNRQSSRADPDRLRASAAAFERIFGRDPSSSVDWKTAEALNPRSFDPKYQGVGPAIKVARIEPVPGQGVVRAAFYIPAAEVFNVPVYDLGDNRAEDPDFDPEHARVVTYVDYENGLIITRQNPSVDTTGEVRVGEPDVIAQQRPDGSVMIQYDAVNPFAPPGSSITGHTVNGTIVLQPTSGNPGTSRIIAGGEITDYPSVEIYQDNSAGKCRPVLIDAADSGGPAGPLLNLPGFHEVGGGKAMMEPFKADFDDPDWERNRPTDLGDPDDPPTVVVVR
ncbi:WXG100 family type VII secretion target [Gordonia amicalis]|uniref:WXG100 family type VII secretion target n=1 Tax=Gordonia amicalis TaxID=89053 RepID=A0ABU4DCY0_9ACTN|nr:MULTISPECIES: WXG100 family type VII secretion target [Gordonia]ATD69968.1 hypothetical protein CNO18_06480 [Gordonia sp. 1D]MDV6306961.1 WXG100 family type VII secretion target [Gordonia amicalis]MDV7100155.1 WXG100 family type VII secretion target [Gordonia amicalis]MDV7174746.1 WXG100 family type VII secretion target [Gordonia amicalis]